MNLETDYLGLRLRNPIILGSSPLCDDVDTARRLDGEGVAALVMRSLFEEQFTPDNAGKAEAGFPTQDEYTFRPEQYLRQLEQVKRAVSIPVIASLNGHNPGGWHAFAQRLASAGADAIELNCYHVATEPEAAGHEGETEMMAVLRDLVQSVRIPVSVKLSPFHSSPADVAVALDHAGCAGLVLFNRFYQPDIDIESLAVHPQLRLSDSSELLLRLRWLAILSPLVRGSLAATGGIHTAEDMIKALLVGADAVQLVSVVLRQGPVVVPGLLASLQSWMSRHQFKSIADFRGHLDLSHCPDPSAFERANYVRTLRSWKA
jgi:dihydroorotate dehydrogenase (fumarate)